ncbi:amidase [Roseomonas sp. CCTCC AB2023176]|uniref:amidase n=1 Tax=Roseomonas sp. CCTCC AB2023176 TaxID=3342640 RepID=UPI0035E16511
MPDPADLPARALIEALRAGRLTPRDVTEACIARVAAREGTVRAFAAHDEAAWRRGAEVAPVESPLAGLPVGVKDVLDAAGLPAGYGSPIWEGWRPRADAACVAMIRRAGGVVAGKTVTTEFATRRPGPTTNPHDPSRTPGGSSQGSAAGVAAGFFPLAYGTQTAGSIIRPAAYCGVVGFKPTYGTIHRGGMRVMSESLDTIGAMARDVFGCALLVGASAGLDLWSGLGRRAEPPRIAFIPGPAEDVLEESSRAMLEDLAARLGRAGGRVERVALPPAVLAAIEAHPVVMQGEIRQALAWEHAAAPDGLSPWLRERAAWVDALPDDALPRAREAFAKARTEFDAFMRDYDFVLTASAPGEAPSGLEATGDPACNLLWTALHAPCVTLPAGVGPHGMPLGVQVVGAIGRDRAILAAAEWVAGQV